MLVRTTDQFVLDRCFQPITDWWQNQTGLSNFWLAKMCIWAAGIAMLIDLYFIATEKLLMGIMYVGFSILALGYISLCERRDKDRSKNSTRTLNPLRDSPYARMIRVTLLGISLLFWFEQIKSLLRIIEAQSIWGPVMISLVACSFYFDACTPKPPLPRKAPSKVVQPTTA